jgi:transposase
LSVPGVGPILAVVIALEVGDVARFATAENLAAYAGTTPRVHASGGKTRFGRLRPDVNRYRCAHVRNRYFALALVTGGRSVWERQRAAAVNLVLYQGVVGAHSEWRARIVA